MLFGTFLLCNAMNRNDLRSQSLDLLRFPLAIVVLTIHLLFPSVYDNFSGSPFLTAMSDLISGMLWDQSVPIYFFISGFVFFLDTDFTGKTYIRKLRNRTKSLLIPYIIWNSAAIMKILLLTLPLFATLFSKPRTISDLDLSAGALLFSFWDQSHGITHQPLPETCDIFPMDSPLWFVRDLMIVVLSTPLIYAMLKTLRQYAVYGLCLTWFVLGIWPLGHTNQLLTAFFFFSWGSFLSICNKDILTVFRHSLKSSAIIYIIVSAAYALCCRSYGPEITLTLKKINQCAGLIVAYNIAAWLLSRHLCKVNHFLASSSFFIYVTHMLVLYEVQTVFIRILSPSSPWQFLIAYALTFITTTTLLLTVFYLLKRYVPGFLKTVTGRK